MSHENTLNTTDNHKHIIRTLDEFCIVGMRRNLTVSRRFVSLYHAWATCGPRRVFVRPSDNFWNSTLVFKSFCLLTKNHRRFWKKICNYGKKESNDKYFAFSIFHFTILVFCWLLRVQTPLIIALLTPAAKKKERRKFTSTWWSVY